MEVFLACVRCTKHQGWHSRANMNTPHYVTREQALSCVFGNQCGVAWGGLLRLNRSTKLSAGESELSS